MANGTIAFDTLQTSGQIQGTAKSVDTDFIVTGSAKAWAVIEGTGTAAFDDSFNCASLADNGTGNYTATYTNAFSSANHSSTMTVKDTAISARCDGGRATTTVNVQCLNTSFGTVDEDGISLTCHGDLA